MMPTERVWKVPKDFLYMRTLRVSDTFSIKVVELFHVFEVFKLLNVSSVVVSFSGGKYIESS